MNVYYLLDNSVVKTGESTRVLNENFSLAEVNESIKRVNGNVKTITEDHVVGTYVPAGELVGIEEVFSENWQLQIVDSLTVRTNSGNFWWKNLIMIQIFIEIWIC